MWSTKQWYDDAAQMAQSDLDFYQGISNAYVKLYNNAIEGASPEQVTKILTDSNAERLAAIPDLKQYPELRGMDELMAARWRGIRDGANLTDAQHAAFCSSTFYYHRHLQKLQPQAAECSAVFFADSDRGPLIAKNLDSNPDEPHGLPGWPAVNEHLICEGVSSGVFCDETSPEIFPAPMHDLIGRYCRTTSEAVEMYQRYNYFWGPGNCIVVDRNCDITILEKSACRIGVRHVEGGFGYVTAMTAHEPKFREYLIGRQEASLAARGLQRPCADTAYWESADKRHHLMGELLEEAKKEPTLEKLRSIMQFRDEERGKVAVGGEIIFPGGQPVEHTLRTSIWILREGKCVWWAKDGDTPSWENKMPDGEYENVWTWD